MPPAPVIAPTPIGDSNQIPPTKRQRVTNHTPSNTQVMNKAPVPDLSLVPSQQIKRAPATAQQPIGSTKSTAPTPPQQAMNNVQQPQKINSGPMPPVTSSIPSNVHRPTATPKPVESGLSKGPPSSGPKPQEDHTLINCFTVEQIETHIESLNRGLQLPPQKLKVKCIEVLKTLQGHQHSWVFNSPVDPVELGLPDYFQVIKRPMDLGSIKKRLENGCYHSLEDFEGDVHLTFDNAMLYNPEGSVVYNMADEMKSKFVLDYEQLLKQLKAEEDEKRKNGDACALCGSEKLLFEPPVFYCNGLSCPSKRIRRNSYYYVGGNNQYHWCHQCYGDLKEGQEIHMADITMKKGQLTKKKNDEVHEESWVQCDRCERWIHQICGLFNTRQNKDQRSEYTCPRCTIDDRKKSGVTEGTSTTPMAEDLQRTKLSEQLQNHVREKTDSYFENAAKEKAVVEVSALSEKRFFAMAFIFSDI